MRAQVVRAEGGHIYSPMVSRKPMTDQMNKAAVTRQPSQNNGDAPRKIASCNAESQMGDVTSKLEIWMELNVFMCVLVIGLNFRLMLSCCESGGDGA